VVIRVLELLEAKDGNSVVHTDMYQVVYDFPSQPSTPKEAFDDSNIFAMASSLRVEMTTVTIEPNVFIIPNCKNNLAAFNSVVAVDRKAVKW